MTFFDSSKSVIENFYLLSGPLLFLTSLVAIRQLKIAKDNIRINSTRQAATMSFELCEKYEKSIQDKHDKLVSEIQDLGIDVEKLFEINPSSFRNLNEAVLNNEIFKKISDNRQILSYYQIELANELEGFCIPFIKKLADEELAYDLQFSQFYYWAMLSLPEIHHSHNLNNNVIEMDYYGNICDLYAIWKGRNEKESIDRQVATLIANKNKIVTKKIKPIGTE